MLFYASLSTSTENFTLFRDNILLADPQALYQEGFLS